MSQVATDFDRQMTDPEFRRLFMQERTIGELTEMICREMQRSGVTKKELARRLGKSQGLISQWLSGGRNLTLRSLSDILLALDLSLDPVARPVSETKGRFMRLSAGNEPDKTKATRPPRTIAKAI